MDFIIIIYIYIFIYIYTHTHTHTYTYIKLVFISSTFEFNVQATEFKFHSLKSLTKGFMVMTDALLCPHAERQGEVCIRLLPIMIRTNSVHPQNNFIMIIILKQMQLCVSIQKLLHKEKDNDSENTLFGTETPMKNLLLFN